MSDSKDPVEEKPLLSNEEERSPASTVDPGNISPPPPVFPGDKAGSQADGGKNPIDDSVLSFVLKILGGYLFTVVVSTITIVAGLAQIEAYPFLRMVFVCIFWGGLFVVLGVLLTSKKTEAIMHWVKVALSVYCLITFTIVVLWLIPSTKPSITCILAGCATFTPTQAVAQVPEPTLSHSDSLPAITLTPITVLTNTPTESPSPTITATVTPSPTYTETPAPIFTPTPFPYDCFEVGEWEFVTGWDAPIPTQSANRSECYNADAWGFYATEGILISRESMQSELRGIRYPLPTSDFNIQVLISLEQMRQTREGNTVDLMVGLGANPAARDNRTFNEWYYHIRDWGDELLAQCVLSYFWDNCTFADAIDVLPKLAFPTLADPLQVRLDIKVHNRQVEAIAYFIDWDGNPAVHEFQGLDPLILDRPWWLWIGYSTMSGGKVRGSIQLYSADLFPAP